LVLYKGKCGERGVGKGPTAHGVKNCPQIGHRSPYRCTKWRAAKPIATGHRTNSILQPAPRRGKTVFQRTEENAMTPAFATYPSLKDKVVYVSGGASGIGAEIVRAFAAQGAWVGFLDLDQKTSAALAADLPGVSYEICDLRDIGALRRALGTLQARLGPATVLVNNAARDDRHDWRDVTPDYWDERQATNLRHQFFAIQTVAPWMISAGGGSIINMGSNSWFEAGGGFPAYATAKAAIHGLTRTMARDLGKHRIRVNAVVPGWIMTDRQKELWATPEALEAHVRRQCLPDFIDPVYVARMVLFLASDDAAMCTASSYMVEAGSI
jgi:D-xylose 1-dehydrogenase